MKVNYSKTSAVAVMVLLAVLMVASVYTVAPVAAQSANDWPMFGNNPAHTRVTTSTAPDKYVVKWRYQTDGPVLSSPAVVGGRVYIGSDDANLYCLDANTGSLVWKYQTGMAVESSPAVVGGNVYFGSLDHNVYCVSTSGTLVWKYLTGSYVFSHPTVVNDRVYIGSMDGNMYCLDAANGDLIWSYEAGPCFKISPAVANGRVYFGSDDSNVTCLDATTGDLIWTYTTGRTIGQSSAAVADGRVFIGSDDTYFYAINETDGTLLWRYNTPQTNYQDFIRSSPAVLGDTVYIGMAHQFTALDVETGGDVGPPTWTFHTGSIQRSSPAISSASGNIYYGHNDLSIYIFDYTSGNRLQSYFASAPWESSVAIANGMIYCGNGNDYVYCFEEATSTVSTTISADVFPTTTEIGFQVTLQGNVFPGISWLNVDITWTKPDGTIIPQTVLAKGDGLYVGSQTVDVPGTWKAMAQFNGFDIWGASTSPEVTFEVTGEVPPAPPAASTISCSAALTEAGDISVSGSLDPATSGSVTLTYYRPDATSTTKTVTASMGSYTDTFTPDWTGNWIVQASWAGDDSTKAARSAMQTVTVPAAAEANGNGGNGGNGEPMPVDWTIPIVVIVVVIIIAAIVVVLMYMRK